MSLEEYDRIDINSFMGLYKRGSADTCPPNHSPICQNMRFNRKGETETRYGTVSSLSTGHNTNRIFTATFSHSTNIILTSDGAGNIYRSDTGGVLLNVANMIDFAAINVFGFCLISPISGVSGGGNSVYIWQARAGGGGDVIPIRKAAGHAPSGSFTAADTGTGHVDIGVHLLAVSFIMDTGFTTQPGPKIAGVFTPVSVTSTGGKLIHVSGIPTGPIGTVARQIFVTQANQTEYFYVASGLINDNTTTTVDLNFYDSDLIVSADSLFDLLEEIPAGNFGEAGGMTFYHGRVFYWGGEFSLIRVTNAGSCESVDNVFGFIQLPDQFDQNLVFAGATLQDSLYFGKSFGIFSAIDNGGPPSSWQIINIDAGVGTVGNFGTINVAQPSLAQNQALLIGDFGGLYVFRGSTDPTPLTWKINDVWQSILVGNAFLGLTVAIDPYSKVIYVYFKTQTTILAGDYNDGLDSQNIKWSIYSFPFSVSAIGMAYFTDSVDTSYLFRIAGGSSLYRLDPTATADSGTDISSIISTYFMAFTYGALNIFRFMRFRGSSNPITSSTLSLEVFGEDNVVTSTPPSIALVQTPGRDYTREFNFENEKASIRFSAKSFYLQRLEVFGKPRFNMRPSV